jgi:hypothetical protein
VNGFEEEVTAEEVVITIEDIGGIVDCVWIFYYGSHWDVVQEVDDLQW